jgi:hypothetical protein
VTIVEGTPDVDTRHPTWKAGISYGWFATSYIFETVGLTCNLAIAVLGAFISAFSLEMPLKMTYPLLTLLGYNRIKPSTSVWNPVSFALVMYIGNAPRSNEEPEGAKIYP